MAARKRRLALALLPSVGALIVARVLFQESVPNPQWHVQADVYAGSLVLVVGIAVSALLVQGLLLWSTAQERRSRELEEQEAASEAARQRFIRRLDHELKNPLTALHAAVMDLDSLAPPPPIHEKARQVESLLLQLERPLVALRKLATLETREIERLPVALEPLLERAVEAVDEMPACAGRKIELTLPNDGAHHIVLGDNDLLWALVYNLLDNACKYSDPQGLVSVKLVSDETGQRVSIVVADTGRGIAPSDLPYVFEDLYRGENVTEGGGSGLGLALVRTIAERHGATAQIASRKRERRLPSICPHLDRIAETVTRCYVADIRP